MLGKPELIGIDIGQYSIKVARMKGGRRLSASRLVYDVIPYEVRESRDQEALKQLVTSAVKKAKASVGQPVVHVNAGDAILREVKVDKNLRNDDLEGAIELELAEVLPFGMDQVYFDFDEKPNSEGLRQTASVRRELADSKVKLLSNLPKSFKSAEVDVDAYALARIVKFLYKTFTGSRADAPIMLVDIGYNRSRFYVYEAGELKFNREQQIGGQQATEIIMDVFDVDRELAETRKLTNGFGDEYQNMVLAPFAQAFSEQLNLAVDFYEATREDSLDLGGIYLIGGGSKLVGLVEALEQYVNHPVALFDSTLSVNHANYGGEFVLSMGLALEGDR